MSNSGMKRQAVLVLGMHRSGTSALTRVINLLGFDLPKNLIPASQHNIKGFWETQLLADFHDRVLESAGSYWHDWSKFNPNWYASPLFTRACEELKVILLAEFGSSNSIVIKDPRICRLLPLWLNVLNNLQIEPAIIIPVRNPLEIASSLRQRDAFVDKKTLLLWLRHVLDAEQSSRGLVRAFCSYEGLLLDWRKITTEIANQIKWVWPRLSIETEIEVDDFLSGTARHHIVSNDELATRTDLPIWISKTYAALDLLIKDPSDIVAQQRLDEIREDFDRGCSLFGVVVRAEERETEKQHQKVAELSIEIAQLKYELENTQQQTESYNRALQEQTIELERLENDLEDIQKQFQINREELREKITSVAQLTGELESSRQKLAITADELSSIRKSIAWRMTAPLRNIGAQFPWLEKQMRPLLEKVGWVLSLQFIQDYRQPSSKLIYEQEINHSLISKVGSSLPKKPLSPYTAWLHFNQWNQYTESEIYDRLAIHDYLALPKISIVIPIYNPPMRFFTRAIQTIKRQLYPKWELCIADDASSDLGVRSYLEELAQDSRISVYFRQENGHISAATNSAASLATGEFLLLMDQDDELAIDALAEIALYIANHPETDLLYSDCDKIDAEGRRYDPHFKPDWSPELLLSYMYAGQVLVVRKSLFNEIGGLRQGFEGSQDHDLALRVGEVARHVGHLPYILYHWRCFQGSTALSGHEKPYSFKAGLNAVQAALERRGSKGQAYQPEWAKRNGNGIYHIRFPDTGPMVTIIIPTHNRADLLSRCLKSLSKTTYHDYQIMVVDNENDQASARRYLDRLDCEVVRIPNPPGQGFSFSYLMNEASRRATTEYILFLNDDTEIKTPEWLSSMIGYAELSGVGAVGALLRYKDGRIQHAGVVHGIDGLCDHAFKLTKRGDSGYLSYITMARNCSAVTAACMLTHRQLFLDLGGFDEERFPVAYNDPDYCYRLREHGYRIVYTPDAELLHFEGQTRGFSDRPQEIAAYRKQFRAFCDPYLNPNLSRENPCFEIVPRRLQRRHDKKLRVAMFTHNLNWEGAPKQMMEIAKFLCKHTMITPLVFSPTDGPLRNSYEKIGIEVQIFSHPLIENNTLPTYLEAITKIGADLADHAIDVVCANTLHGFVAVDIAHAAHLPCLWIIHESEGWKNYFDFVPSAIRSRAIDCFKYPYRVVFVAKQTREIYRELEVYHNFIVIPNGLEPDAVDYPSEIERKIARNILGLDSDEIGILSVGTICDRKRQIDLIEAITHIDDSILKSHRLRFFIVGDRDNGYSRQLHTIVDSMEPTRRALLTIVPETPDVMAYYHACDIFVLTSGLESYPRVILEAMSAGLAIITTPVNGVVEQVREGVNTDYFSVGHVRQLTERLTTLIDDLPRRERYCLASPLVLQGLTSYEEMGNSYAELFREAALSGMQKNIYG